MAAPVPGQTFEVRARLANRGGITVAISAAVRDSSASASTGWKAIAAGRWRPVRRRAVRISSGISKPRRVPRSPWPTTWRSARRPYFSRNGLQESRYTLSDPAQFGKPASHAAAEGGGAVLRSTACRSRCAKSCKTARSEAALRRRASRGAQRAAPRRDHVAHERDCAADSGTSQEAVPRQLHVEVSLLHNAESANNRPGRRSGCPQAGSRSRRRSRSRSRERASGRRIDSP